MTRLGFAFNEEHELFRDTVRRFIATTLETGNLQWEKDGLVPRSVWREAGELGLLCPSLDPEYGGAGADFLCDVVLVEEMSKAGLHGPLAGFMVHSNMAATYILSFGTEAQKKAWLPRAVSGEVILALGLTEPSAGSDLRGIKTRAKRVGDEYVISGQKVFISNGQNAGLVILATKLEGTPDDAITLILVEGDRPGFARGKNLEKIGLKSQDTSELFFDEVRVPVGNLLGEEGRGMRYLSAKLAEERLMQAIRSAAVTETVIDWTIAYTSERKAFGKTIADFQNTQFKLAELTSEARVVRAFVDSCIAKLLNRELNEVDAAIAKLRACELHCKAVDECLQLHGGWGYVWETPIARAYADARIVKISGGAVEIMKVLIARAIFPRKKSAPTRG